MDISGLAVLAGVSACLAGPAATRRSGVTLISSL
jgi:hypothetical protein